MRTCCKPFSNPLMGEDVCVGNLHEVVCSFQWGVTEAKGKVPSSVLVTIGQDGQKLDPKKWRVSSSFDTQRKEKKFLSKIMVCGNCNPVTCLEKE